MELVGVFTRRNPDSIKLQTEGAKAYHIDEAENMTDKIDLMILCGGSKGDLPEQGHRWLPFNTVDAYDTHALIPSILQRWTRYLSRPIKSL